MHLACQVQADSCLGWTWNGPSNEGCYFKNETVRMQLGAKQQVSSTVRGAGYRAALSALHVCRPGVVVRT